jgi:Flp pilus assembly protein TadB
MQSSAGLKHDRKLNHKPGLHTERQRLRGEKRRDSLHKRERGKEKRATKGANRRIMLMIIIIIIITILMTNIIIIITILMILIIIITTMLMIIIIIITTMLMGKLERKS